MARLRCCHALALFYPTPVNLSLSLDCQDLPFDWAYCFNYPRFATENPKSQTLAGCPWEHLLLRVRPRLRIWGGSFSDTSRRRRLQVTKNPHHRIGSDDWKVHYLTGHQYAMNPTLETGHAARVDKKFDNYESRMNDPCPCLVKLVSPRPVPSSSKSTKNALVHQ
ncbi:hypothetical protein K456DRAFT_1471510 [Colletotrichum gloeosporioides 23]|nr:hypothetical protein K456DRAFT_1471510 [Colletotrichum gloeosporioides 23]